ncbi:MAG: PEGA domain-containing protein [Fibrobacteria bacterium]|nr:PEGA domain-containing protein [Fibrobacteria bacterium]
MKTFLFLLLLLLGASSGAGASGSDAFHGRPRTPTIAILPFLNANQEAVKDGLGVSMAAMFGTHLKNETSFTVLERGQLSRILGEQSLETSGVTDIQRQQLGRLLQVEAILTGEVSRFGSLVQMDARLVSVETGQVLVAEYASIEGYGKMRESVVAISKTLEMKYLRRWMGDLVVSVQPVDAEVYLEDQYAGKATVKTPLRLSNLMEGRYALRILAQGYSTVLDTAMVAPRGVKDVQYALRALPGGLRMVSEPTGAQVLVDGKSVGRAPVTLDTLLEGRYHLAFQLDGFRTLERDVEVRSGQQSDVKGILEVLPGRVKVASEPRGAITYLDDKRVGWAPLVIENIPPGTHSLRLELPGRRLVRDVVTVKPGEEVAWTGRLDPLLGTLTVVPRTDSVSVRILDRDGGLLEEVAAPFHKRELEIGEWTLEYIRPHHDTLRERANLLQDKELRLEPLLAERKGRLSIDSPRSAADVWIDGRYVGRTGRARADLAKGRHVVRWSSYFHEGVDTVEVKPDEIRRLEIPDTGPGPRRWMVAVGIVLSTLLLFAAGR